MWMALEMAKAVTHIPHQKLFTKCNKIIYPYLETGLGNGEGFKKNHLPKTYLPIFDGLGDGGDCKKIHFQKQIFTHI